MLYNNARNPREAFKVAHEPPDSMWALRIQPMSRCLTYGFFRKRRKKAENTKTIPMFTISRSQNRFLKNSKSTLVTTAVNTST